ncbi:L,D-transpeptidase [Streptomyces fuscigenes]|uniref:L,D-transpeptidase n=1 Tax=Streptomyces fuscigenes TaxID=1528880 RepID=UPI001F490271|nr:Ig-like domain-containing protein [Streptomyces fuscigenes]MCF3964839.1 Ig-like domain-containing protein [Streptomyces fuscigenes]
MEKRVMTARKRRTSIAAASAALGGVLVLSACGGGHGGGSGDAASSPKQSQAAAVDKAAAQDTSDAKIAITPGNGSDNASINNAAKVSVTDGTLTNVSLTTADGTAVKGTLAADGKSWSPDAQLSRSTTYKIAATAKDSKGRGANENSTFTTVSPSNSFIGNFTPEDGSTVGVGMPVSINFDKSITDKKDVQSHIQVSSTSGQQVVGHWFNSQRLDFRPQNYWQAGSKVTLKLNLDGVQGAKGTYGVQQKTVTFTVGRNQVSTVDAAAHTMVVQQDGKTVRTIPISAGSPEHTTYNGQMVISEKYKKTRMNGATVGFTDSDGKGEYDIKDVPDAMRLTNSGTFVHGNYWGGPSVFGNSNTSHGCVGLQDVKGAGDPNMPAHWFFDHSLLGDVVVVKNSHDKTVQPDNGLNGWNMSWADWQAGSAV